jgi:hypothetical protein
MMLLLLLHVMLMWRLLMHVTLMMLTTDFITAPLHLDITI